MTEHRTSRQADIAWEGDSKDIISSFPHDVRGTLGFSLRLIQKGENPRCEHRSMTSVGKGVWELKEGDERTWYRVMYLSKIDNVIHVLHCFEKDSKKTDQRDIETAKKRLQDVHQRIVKQQQQRKKKRKP